MGDGIEGSGGRPMQAVTDIADPWLYNESDSPGKGRKVLNQAHTHGKMQRKVSDEMLLFL